MSLEFIIRNPRNIEEARAVQAMDDASWKNGFQHYARLFEIDPSLILIAMETREGAETGRMLGYIGVERFMLPDLDVGFSTYYKKSMPPWNHNPNEYHKNKGDIYHVTGGNIIPDVIREGVWLGLIQTLSAQAHEKGIRAIATTFNLRHLYVKNPLRVWGNFGFFPLINTYDPNWNHDGTNHPKEAANDGSIIWYKDITLK